MFTGVSLRVEPTLQLGDGLTLPGEISPMSIRPPGETLEESMTRLERGLVTGTLLLQFEVRTCYSAHGVSWCACMCFANCYPSMCVWVCVCFATRRNWTGRKSECCFHAQRCQRIRTRIGTKMYYHVSCIVLFQTQTFISWSKEG